MICMDNYSEILNNFESMIPIISKKRVGGDMINAKGKINKELLTGNDLNKSDLLYDAAFAYLSEKKYREAEICLMEICSIACWEDDETLQPATYSLLAVANFNVAIKKHAGSRYKIDEFSKAIKFAEKSDNCQISSRELEIRSKTGAWQVLLCTFILCKNVWEACRIKAKHNMKFMAERSYKPWEANNNWFVGSELGDVYFEERLIELFKIEIYKNPDEFERYYELFLENKKSYNYTELLTYATTFVENNISRTILLYESLFEYVTIKNTNFYNYFFLACEKLSAIMFSGDHGELKRTLKRLDDAKDNHLMEYENSPQELKYEYQALRLIALIEMYEIEEACQYSKTISADNDLILYAMSRIWEQRREFEKAEQAGIASIAIRPDAFKMQALGAIFLNQKKYDKAKDVYEWAIETVEKDIKKNEKFQGPLFLPSLKRPSRIVLKELYLKMIETLKMMDLYAEAYCVYEKYSQMKEAQEKNAVLVSIQEQEKLYKIGLQAGKEKNIIQKQLEDRENKIRRMVEVQNQWYNDLVSSQIIDECIEITDEMWETTSIKDKMNSVISKIQKVVQTKDQEGFKKELKKASDRYPNLTDKALKYLASAEQIYNVFKENDMIDCAPVLVEYARVYEESIWNYLEKSEEYREAKNEQLKDHCRSLGSAGYIIRNYTGKLKKYAPLIRTITEMRNNSAHAYISKIPEIKKMRELIWDSQRNLLDEL